MTFSVDKEDDLVRGIYTRQTHDPKDKAFAMRAILQRLLNRELPQPDYQASIGVVHTEFCAHLIEATDSLNVLLYATMNKGSDRPSWVPDFTQQVSEF